MTTPYRSDQRRVMITLPADRYKELKATARANSLPMTAILNALIGDYLKAERNGAADTGAGLADRVEALEKRLAILSATVNKAPRRRNRRGEPSTDAGEREQPPTGSPEISTDAPTPTAMTVPKRAARGTLDDQHARAADLSKCARVPLASSLARGAAAPGAAVQSDGARHDHADDRAQRLEETKRRAASYAIHGARYDRGPFIINGAGT